MPRRGFRDGERGGQRRPAKEAWLAFLFYALLTAGMTWPLLERPQSQLHGNADVYGNVWAMSWVAHQLPRDPLRLFDSNMYFPHPGSLGYAESLLPQGLQALVVTGLGGSAALAYNLVLLLTFPVAGLGAMLLARELGATRGPAFLAGLGFAFCAYRWDHLVHVQSLSCGWLPFVLLFSLRTLRRPSFRSALGAGAFAWLQVLSSGYYALLVAIAVALLAAAEGAARAPRTRPAAGGALDAAGSAPRGRGRRRARLPAAPGGRRRGTASRAGLRRCGCGARGRGAGSTPGPTLPFRTGAFCTRSSRTGNPSIRGWSSWWRGFLAWPWCDGALPPVSVRPFWPREPFSPRVRSGAFSGWSFRDRSRWCACSRGACCCALRRVSASWACWGWISWPRWP